MFRLTSFVKAFAIAFAVAFSLAFGAGALLRSPAKPWSEVMGISAFVAVTLGLFIAWKLDEFRSAQLQYEVVRRVMQGRSSAILIDAKGNVIPEDLGQA